MATKQKFGLDDITAIICNYKTEQLTRQCVESFREHYPTVKIILVDNGSKDGSTEYINNLDDPFVVKILNEGNYGHGPAMHQAIEDCQTRYVFALDSDTITEHGGFLELMLAEAVRGAYAVGFECETDRNGFNIVTGGGVRYIHPMAAIYDVQIYHTLPQFAHHGAPCIYNMIEANERGLKLVHFQIDKYIKHLGEGTRSKVGGWSPNVVRVDQFQRPFVSFVTRCYKRPAALLRCMTSIARQTDPDYENVLIVDEDGIGVVRANALYQQPQNMARVRGRYVHLIDDDDYICDPDMVATVKCIAAEANPDVIIFRVRHPGNIVLPDRDVWMKKPVGGHIGGSSVVVRGEVWKKHIHWFGDKKVYWGDFVFINELFDPRHNYSIYWCSDIVVDVPHQNIGKVE